METKTWKMKRLIKELEEVRGGGTSMISLYIPAGGQVSRMVKMLVEEAGAASNIKSRVNRQSVQDAITWATQRLKQLNNKVPPNGLCLFTGIVMNEQGKERRLVEALEPPKPLSLSLYMCDNKFHVQALRDLLACGEQKFGFIVIDGNGVLYGTLSREVLHKFSVELPKKHGRGGQSALRFSRNREECRHNYVRKVAETAVKVFIDANTNQLNVVGLVLAGAADLKDVLGQSGLFDSRLQTKVVNVVDVQYGGENGFNQAIQLSAEKLGAVKFIQEKILISRFFDEIRLDAGKYVFGVKDTIRAMEAGAVDTLIVWEDLDVTRYVLKNSLTGRELVKYLDDKQTTAHAVVEEFRDDAEMEGVFEVQVDATSLLVEWLVDEYANLGCKLEMVTNRSDLGSQFCRGFGGIGGILRYPLELTEDDEDAQGSEDSEVEEDDSY